MRFSFRAFAILLLGAFPLVAMAGGTAAAPEPGPDTAVIHWSPTGLYVPFANVTSKDPRRPNRIILLDPIPLYPTDFPPLQVPIVVEVDPPVPLVPGEIGILERPGVNPVIIWLPPSLPTIMPVWNPNLPVPLDPTRGFDFPVEPMPIHILEPDPPPPNPFEPPPLFP
jgi:hypothetical protein